MMNEQKQDPTIHLTISNTKFHTFKRIFDPFSYLFDEFSFYFTKDRVTIKNLTDDRIAFVHVTLSKDFFDNYIYNATESLFIRRIETSYFKLILYTTAILDKAMKQFTMNFFNDKVITDISSEFFHRQHTTPIHELPTNELLNFAPEQLKLSNSCQVNPKILWQTARILKLTNNVRIIPTIDNNKDKLLIVQEHKQDKNAVTRFTVPVTKLNVKDKTRSIGYYDSKWLYIFSRVAKVLPHDIQNVTMSWQEDAPLRIVYTLENAEIAYVAAPLLRDDVP